MASYASPSKNPDSDYEFETVPGKLVSSGLGTLTALANKYKDNEVVGNLAVGGIADVGKTQANTGLAAAYNDAFLGSLQRFTGAENRQKAELTKDMLTTETALESKREQEGYDRKFSYEQNTLNANSDRVNRYARNQFG
jgi:hypothetical protein